MMRKLKRYVLMFLTAMICLNCYNARILADDDQYDNQTYSATYEFIEESGKDLPEEVMALLPETRSELKTGTVITNEMLEDIETDDSVFYFVSWNYDEYAVEDSDIVFTGTWRKTEKNDDSLKQDVQVNGSETVSMTYMFLEAYHTESDNLPKEVMELLPENRTISRNADQSPEPMAVTQVGEWSWQGWNPYHDEEGNVTYFGIWMSPDSRFEKPERPGLLRASSSATFVYSGYWTVPNACGYSGESRFTLDGDVAFCIEPNVHMDNTYRGATYVRSGSTGGTSARIAVMGKYNGVDEGSIQAAIWNAILGTSAGGADCQPDYWGYDDDGWRIPEVDVYTSGSKQTLICNIPSPEPDTGKLKLKKVSSDSNYPYGSYTNNYSLAGAVYGVYTDQACTNEVYTLTTNANGDSNTLEFNNDATYYVKEKTPSKGFGLDSNIYTARVTRGSTVTITSNEVPYNDPVIIVLKKQNVRHPEKVKYLDEAEFTVRYYDTQEDEVSAQSPKKTWVFKPIYTENGDAVITMDEEHYVSGDQLPLNAYGDFYLPLGTFTIQETKAPQTYQIDPNIYVGHIYREDGETKSIINGGEYLTVENEALTQSECEVIISTTAIFEENGEHRYVADGVAHIVDVVEYDYLIPGDYYKIKAKLMQVEVTETRYSKEEYDAYVGEHGEEPEWQVGDIRERTKTEIGEVAEAEVLFSPKEESGTQNVVFDGIDFDDRANTDYVVYEYLYHCEVEIPTPEPGPDPQPEPQPESEPVVISEEQVTYHEDLYDEGQSVHVDELYRADFLLYKIGDGNRNIKLSGAYFDVKTHRVKRDGREIDHELGTYVTGGIYIPGEDEVTQFTVRLYSDPKPAVDPETGEEIPPESDDPVFVEEYASELNKKFSVQAVTILGLEDGIYYTQINDEDDMKTWRIEKGMIFLPMQEEDTEITFRELIAPQGYYLESRPFVMSVGHDYELLEVENYRSNSMIIIPHTGYEG